MGSVRRAAGPVIAALLFVIAAPAASGQQADNGVEVSPAVHHDVSPPVAGMRPASPTAHRLTERPLRLVGFIGPDLPDLASMNHLVFRSHG